MDVARWEISYLCLLAKNRHEPRRVKELTEPMWMNRMSRPCRALVGAILHPRKSRASRAVKETAKVFCERADARRLSREARYAHDSA